VFGAISSVVFVLTVGVIEHSVGDSSGVYSISQFTYWFAMKMTRDPGGYFFLSTPFLLTGIPCAYLAGRRGFPFALRVYIPTLAIVALIYHSGLSTSQRMLEQHAWTASELSSGLLPFECLPIVILLVIVVGVLRGRDVASQS
jgi:hypothetical protein